MKFLTRLFQITLLISFFSHNTLSQLPDSIAITTNGSWIIEHNNAYEEWNSQANSYVMTNHYSYDYFRSGNDTLINGTSYTQLVGHSIVRNSNGTFDYNSSTTENYKFAYRNDLNRAAFRVLMGTTAEEPWYDFNPVVADTVWDPNTLVNSPYIVITMVDSIDFCGTNYANYHYYDLLQTSIQRVGSTINFFKNYPTPFERDKIIHFCEESVSFQTIAGIEENSDNDMFTIYPNPSKDMVQLSIKNNATPERVTFHNLAGEIILQDYSGVTSFSIENFISGIYFVTIELKGIEQTLRLVKI